MRAGIYLEKNGQSKTDIFSIARIIFLFISIILFMIDRFNNTRKYPDMYIYIKTEEEK